MDNIQKTIISISDKYGDHCLVDGFQKNKIQKENLNRKPEGYVEIFSIQDDGEKQLVGKSNLVVYQGREWLAERIFDTENASSAGDKDDAIYWLGLGDGGAPVGDPLTPNTPTNLDTDLANSIPIIDTSDPVCADPSGGYYYKHPFDSVTFVQDTDNDSKYLIAKVSTTISTDDANGYNLNEAGLFMAASDAAGYSGTFTMFSRVCFSSLVKDSSRSLLFIWYVYV